MKFVLTVVKPQLPDEKAEEALLQFGQIIDRIANLQSRCFLAADAGSCSDGTVSFQSCNFSQRCIIVTARNPLCISTDPKLPSRSIRLSK
jgi:hypothetical protein